MSDSPQSKIDALSLAVTENTKATLAMSSALRTIYLVLLALASMGLAAWLLKEGKISEANFMALMLVCLSPFFGEGIGRILDRMPIIGKKAEAMQKAAVIAFAVGSLFLTGCTLRFPIGDGGRYGTATVGYELPEQLAELPTWKPAPAAKRNGNIEGLKK